MWFLAFFALVWNGILIGFLFSEFAPFAIFHLLAGVMIAWLTITRFVNHTRITVDRSELRIEHGPIPWPFAKRQLVPARALRQLVVKRSSTKVNNQPTYNLIGQLDTGAEVKLIKTELDEERLRHIEQTIETYLNIKDDPALSEGGRSLESLDLEQLREHLEKLEPLKRWLPKPIRREYDKGMERLRSAEAGQATGRPNVPPRRQQPTAAEPDEVTLDQGWLHGGGSPRALPDAAHDFVFELYRVRTGDRVLMNQRPFTVAQTAQLDFREEADFGRQLELRPAGDGESVFIYGQTERNRWAYYEERRLDDGEVSSLGFRESIHPSRFNNGDDRYYPRDQQEGTRYFSGASGRAFEQFIYFSTGSRLQFRALRPLGGAWEVYVMEAVDGGFFAGG